MIHKLFRNFAHHFVSRWVIFGKDLLLLAMALIAAYLLRFNFSMTDDQVQNMWMHLVMTSAVSIISFLIFKPYAGIIRHTSLEDIIRLAKSIAFNGVAILLLNISIPFWGKGWFPHMPYSIMIIYILSGLFLLLFTRMIIKILFSTFTSTGVLRRNVLIFGAGKAGLTTLQVINADKDSGMKAVGFLDHNPLLQGKAISGVPVYSPDAVNEAFIEKLKVKDIIFSVQNISPEEKRELIEALIAQASVVVKEIPPASSWINGELSLKQLNKVKIEDLLQRAPIKLSMDHVVKEDRKSVV